MSSKEDLDPIQVEFDAQLARRMANAESEVARLKEKVYKAKKAFQDILDGYNNNGDFYDHIAIEAINNLEEYHVV